MAETGRRKLRDSLKFKLGLLITSLVVSTVLLIGAILLRQQRNSLTAEMTKRGLTIASNLAAAPRTPRKSLVLSFDDGYKSFLQYAYPILKELGFTATLFVYTDYIGAGRNALTWADLKKLGDEGFQIEAHSKSHGDMRRASGESAAEYAKRMTAELNQPRELFLKNLGRYPETLAYPYGRQDDTVVQRAKERGYVAGFTVRRQGNPSFTEPLTIHRSQIYSEMSLEDFVKNLNLFNKETLQ
jgi:peptidoglycan/xylan/chitin deacetylase (PgdA/CDA1 family)